MKGFLLAATAALVFAAPAVAAPKTTTATTTTSTTSTSKSSPSKTSTSKTSTPKTTTSKTGTSTTTTSNADAPATVACRNKIINEWEGTGKIRTTYPLACYHLALTYVSGHADLTEYSSLGDDIKLALQAALQRSHGKKVPVKVGKHYGKGGGDTAVGFTTTITKPGANGDVTTNGEAGSQVSGSSSGAPLPILILGGVALALIAAGAIGSGVRYTRRRRNG